MTSLNSLAQFKFRSILDDQRRLKKKAGDEKDKTSEGAAFHSILLLSKVLKKHPDVVVPNFEELAENIHTFYEEVRVRNGVTN